MQICHDHWHEINNAIRQRGLWKLVTPDGYAAASSLQFELQKHRPGSTPDPLVMESSLLYEQALLALGDRGTERNGCPLCEVDRDLGVGMAIEWIDADAETILQFFQAQKLVGREDF